MSLYKEKLIKAYSVDELVKKGIKYIQESGERIWTTSGLALQSNNVTYVLENSLNRIHTLRAPTSIKYFARELFAYFVGSLKVDEGLSNASKFWNKIADENTVACEVATMIKADLLYFPAAPALSFL